MLHPGKSFLALLAFLAPMSAAQAAPRFWDWRRRLIRFRCNARAPIAPLS